ncbi:MAG TPA: hypothetical protein VNE42_07220 [Acidimicrobiales bacterium]|nr:hypothetical protein [Acidimicrobiales bacterium]
MISMEIATSDDNPAGVNGELGAVHSLPPTLSTTETATILNQSISTIERYAAAGILPTLARRGTGAPWRIITTRLLVEHLGFSEEQVMAIVRFPIRRAASLVAPMNQRDLASRIPRMEH